MSGAIVVRRGGAGIGAATGAAAGGVCVASEAMTIGCGGRSGRAACAGRRGCGAMAASPAATFAMTGVLLAAVALVSSADTATKPRNSTTGSHWTAIRDRAFALMFNTPRPGR